MKRLLCALMLALAFCLFAHAQDTATPTRRIVLKNALPSQIQTSLLTFKTDLTLLVFDDTARTVTMTGSKKSLDNLEKVVRFLDTKPIPIRLKMRLVQLPHDGSDNLREQTTEAAFQKAPVIAERILETGNNNLCMTDLGVTLEGGVRWSISVTPRRSGDKWVHMQLTSYNDDPKSKVLSITGEHVRSYTWKWDTRIRSGSSYYLYPGEGNAFTDTNGRRWIYVLQITPTLL